jgi:anaphase-promoting complex subunit 4
MFHAANQAADDSVDVLLTGFDNGTLHVSIYDCFEIGSFNLEQAAAVLKGCEPLLHASHPYISTHTLFACTDGSPERDLYFIPLDLRFISIAASTFPYLLQDRLNCNICCDTYVRCRIRW